MTILLTKAVNIAGAWRQPGETIFGLTDEFEASLIDAGKATLLSGGDVPTYSINALPRPETWPENTPILISDSGLPSKTLFFSNGNNFTNSGQSSNYCYKKKLAFVGDSQTQRGSYYLGNVIPDNVAVYYLSVTFTNITNNFIRNAAVDSRAGTGTGSLTWTPSTTSLTWTAPGDTAGTPVDVTGGGYFYIPSGSANKGIIVGLNIVSAPATTQTDSVSVSGNPTSARSIATGYAGWVEALSKVAFDDVYNFGISGDTSSGLVLRLHQIINSDANFVVLMIGTNDIDGTSAATAASTLATLKTNLLGDIIPRLVGSGKTLLVGTIPAGSAASANKAQAIMEANTFITQYCQNNGIDCFDCYAQTVNPVSSSAAHITDRLASDNLHINSKGAYSIAKNEIIPILNKFIPTVKNRLGSALLYDATVAKSGNLFIRGMFLGVAGTLNTGITGTVPTGVTLVRGSGTTVTCVSTAPEDGSPIARTDGIPGNWWRMVITGNTGDYLQAYGSAFMTAGNFAAGDIVEAFAEIQMSGTGIYGVSLSFNHATPTTTVPLFLYEATDASNIMADLNGDTVSMIVRSNKYQIPSGATNFQMVLTMQVNTGGTATIDTQRWFLRKVIS